MSLMVLDPKDPNDVIDYRVDWSRWLPAGDTILTSEWLAPTPVGLTIDSDAHDTSTTTVWFSSGIAGTAYSTTNRITTAQGRTKDRTITIRVKEL